MWRKQSPQAIPWNSAALTARLDTELDALLKRLPAGVVGEIFYYAPGPKCLVTVAIRPDTAVLLSTRLRTRRGLLGGVVETGEAYGGAIDIIKIGAQRLDKSTSALVLPIRANGQSAGDLLGVVNFESHSREEPLTLDSGKGFEDALARIAKLLAEIPTDALADDVSVARFVLDRIEKEIAFILDPKELDEIYRQLRHAIGRLTSLPRSNASIILKHVDAQQLGFAGDPPASDGNKHEWVVPVPNKGDALEMPGPWDLLAEESVTKQVIFGGELKNLGDVTDPEVSVWRKKIKPPFDRGSELNVPIADSDGPFGTLILLSTQEMAFNAEDERMATIMARYIAVVTRRIEGFREQTQHARDTEDQQSFKSAIDKIIQPLYADGKVWQDISRRRDEALRMIAEEAQRQTHSEVGAVVLKERVNPELVAPQGASAAHEEQLGSSEPPYELVWNESYYQSALPLSPLAQKPSLFRLKPGDGLVGYAFERDKGVLIVQNVKNPEQEELRGKYIEAFQGVQSELVAPFRGRRAKLRGVIDVESSIPGHYSKRDQQWAEYLAQVATEVLEAVDLAARRWFHARLAEYDHAMDGMRILASLNRIQEVRIKLLTHLIDQTRILTEAKHAQIYVTVDAYDDKGKLKRSKYDGTPTGALGLVVSSSSVDIKPSEFVKHISLTEGMAGQVVQSGNATFFKDGERPSYYRSNPTSAESALVVPISIGKRVIGVINLESDNPRWCGELQIRLAEYAAQLAAFIDTNYKMCVESIQAKLLHLFGLETEHVARSDIKDYLHRVLDTADNLTSSPAPKRWALVALMRDRKPDFFTWQEFRNELPDGHAKAVDVAVDIDDEDERVLRDKAILQAQSEALYAALSDHESLFIPNIAVSPKPLEIGDFPWEGSQSYICVPMLVNVDVVDNTEDAQALKQKPEQLLMGYLLVASSHVYHLNDSDHAILRNYAEVVKHGLLDIAHLYSRASLMREVRGQFNAIGLPDQGVMNDLYHQILQIGHSDASEWDTRARAAAGKFRNIEDNLLIVGQLAHWYLLLSGSYPLASASDSSVSTAGDSISLETSSVLSEPQKKLLSETHLVALSKIKDTLLKPMDFYVKQQSRGRVHWSWVSEGAEQLQIQVTGGFDEVDEAIQVLCAVVYGCIASASAAVRRGGMDGHDIYISFVEATHRTVDVIINYYGEAITEKDLLVLPYFRQESDLDPATYELKEQQLVEVRRIARSLGGNLTVPPSDPNERHAIILRLPFKHNNQSLHRS